MKKVALLIASIVVSSFIFAQKIELKLKVDERCELLSTIFRLAGAKEYVTHEIPFYVDNLDKYFEPYKNHEIIDYCKTYRENYGVGYDAPMSLAVHLQIIDGKISLIPNVKENSLSNRWNRDSLPRLIELKMIFMLHQSFTIFLKVNLTLLKK